MIISPAARLEHGRQTLDEADRYQYLGNLAGAAATAYLSMMWVAEALLNWQSMSYQRGPAIHTAFARKFVETRELDPKYHRWMLDGLRQYRTATSKLAVEFDETVVDTLIERAEEFLEVGERYLEWVEEDVE